MFEIKCRYEGPDKIAQLWDTVPEYYMTQIQGQLEICDQAFCDFVAWCPSKGMRVIRVERQPAYWEWMQGLMEEFLAYYESDIPPPRLKRKPQYSGPAIDMKIYTCGAYVDGVGWCSQWKPL